jgi:hypothetical protein
MTSAYEHLSDLASRVQRGDSQAWATLQQELHPGLLPIVRRALRAGAGSPAVARFLTRALSAVLHEDGTQIEEILARMLSLGLASQLAATEVPAVVSSAETIVDGAELVGAACA